MKKLLLTTLLFFTSQSFGQAIDEINLDLSLPETKHLQPVYDDCKHLRMITFNSQPRAYFVCIKKDDSAKVWGASISHSTDGKQRLYVYTPRECDEANSTDVDNTTVNVNGQNVRFLQFCSEGETYYMTLAGTLQRALRQCMSKPAKALV